MQYMPLIVYNLVLITLGAKHKKSNYKAKIELQDTHALVCQSPEAFVEVQIPRPHSPSFSFSRSGMRRGICLSHELSTLFLLNVTHNKL